MGTVVFLNPFTGRMEQIPVQMISAYVPFASFLNLEAAARVAVIRDDEAATNLLQSINTEYRSETTLEGAGYDPLSVEPPSLR